MTAGQTVAEVGERGVIAAISGFLAPKSDRLPVPAGDDCAVARVDEAMDLHVLTTDLLVEHTHFVRETSTDWKAVGRRAMVANLSDLAAMGAQSAYALISIGVPGDFPMADLVAIYTGLSAECNAWNAYLVGGDTVRSDRVVINIALTGTKRSTEAPCVRSGCKPGQKVYVSGALGGCRAGLALQLDPKLKSLQSKPFTNGLISRQQVPEPRLSLGQFLATQCADVAMVDISDGLHNELCLLAEASQVGFDIDLAAVPVYPGVSEFCSELGLKPQQFALFSGEEYELLFCSSCDEDTLGNVRSCVKVDIPITCIGSVVPGQSVQFHVSGRAITVKDESFRHFT